MMYDNAHVIDLLPAYALGVLNDEEIAIVEAFLRQNPRYQVDLNAYRSVVDQLGHSTLETSPPSTLKMALMEGLQAPQSRINTPLTVERTAPQSTLWQRLWPNFAPALSLATALIILILGFTTLLRWSQEPTAPPNLGTLSAISLVSTDAAPGGNGFIIVSEDGRLGTLIVDKLPVLDQEQQQYQLWLIKDNSRTSGALFAVRDNGYGSVWIKAPDPLISYEGFGISIEPSGGSTSPTGDVVLRSRTIQ